MRDSNMVYCAAFGCNNQAKRGNRLRLFSFPKVTLLCKRRSFVPGPSHRLCFPHFSKDSFTQDPLGMAELCVRSKFQARLKPDPVPSFVCLLIYEFWLSLWKIARCSVILLLPLSIPLTVSREVKDGRPIQPPMPRRAFEKRRKAEVRKFMHI